MTTAALPAVGRPPSGQGRVILRMSVQLPDGQRGTIHVFPGSDPHALAEEFCTKHNLTDPKLLMVRARRPPPATPPTPYPPPAHHAPAPGSRLDRPRASAGGREAHCHQPRLAPHQEALPAGGFAARAARPGALGERPGSSAGRRHQGRRRARSIGGARRPRSGDRACGARGGGRGRANRALVCSAHRGAVANVGRGHLAAAALLARARG